MLIFCPLLLKINEVANANGNNPKRTGQFDRGSNLQRFLTICLTGTYYRTGIVNGYGRPCSKFMLAHVQCMPDNRKDETVQWHLE